MRFFDYTSLQDEVVHGLTLIERVAPIIILLLLVFAIYRFQNRIKSFKREKYIRYGLAFFMLVGELSYMAWNFTHSLNNEVDFISTLPLHLCSYAIWGLMISLVYKSEKIYNYIFMFGIVSVLALVFPNLNHGFNSFRYYQLFFSHSLLILAIIYLYKVHDFHPKKIDFVKSFVLLQIIIIISLLLNVWLDTEFLFIGPGNKPIDFAWDWPYHLIQYEAVMMLLYFTFYKIITKIKQYN